MFSLATCVIAALPLAFGGREQLLLQVASKGAWQENFPFDQLPSKDASPSPSPSSPTLGMPGVGIADRSFLGKGYNTMETDMWTFENVYPTEFYKLDTPDTCFRQRQCSRTEVVETSFFDSVTEFSRSFYSSFGIELSGKFMGIEGSLSASIQKSMAQHGEDTKAILEMRIYKRSGCYQMRGECAFDPGALNPTVLETLESLPLGSDDASAMSLWEERFVERFGTHVSLGSEHGAQVRAIATSSSNQQGMEHFLKSALKAQISLEWGDHVGGSLGVSSETEDEEMRRLAQTSYSVRCSSIGGNPDAPSPCIKVEASKTETSAEVVEDRLKDFFQPEDVSDGKSVFSMYFKDMSDIFNHMGLTNYSHAVLKAGEYHRCRAPFVWAKAGDEHTCQCDLQCKNGGQLDEESCTCRCPADEFHGWTGTDCSQLFGTCQMGPNSGKPSEARKCAVDNTCSSLHWKKVCHSTEVCCLTEFDGACCPLGHSCNCNANSCSCVPPPEASLTALAANRTTA